MEQQIRFCTTSDGAQLAYATLGDGPPLVVVHGWAASQEFEWEHPEARAFRESLAQGRLFVAFDNRGVGASQRDIDEVTLDAQVADLATVVDHLELEQVDLFGQVDGAAICVAYAAKHPERVSRLVLWAPYARGEDTISPEAARGVVELIRGNWPMARRAMADVVFPNGPTDQRRRISRMFRESVTPEVAARYFEFYTSLDVRPFLPQVQAPTLVVHRRGDRMVPIAAGRAAAALIPGARFVTLEGDAAIWYDHARLIDVIRQFLDEGAEATAGAQPPAPGGLATILFTDMESSTALTQRLGDARAQELLRTHNAIVREALRAHGGSEIKHTGDGIMASFPSASGALECALAIQQAMAEQPDSSLRVRIGLNAGEPVAEEQDLFGTAVQLARRVCDHAEPGQILAPIVVRELAAGKGFLFSDRGETALRGFEDPVRLYEVRWSEEG